MEEFQVLKDFLSSLRNQKEAEIWQYQGSLNGKDPVIVKTEVAIMIAQRNLLAMLENLPAAVEAVEQVLEAQKRQQENFAKSQR